MWYLVAFIQSFSGGVEGLFVENGLLKRKTGAIVAVSSEKMTERINSMAEAKRGKNQKEKKMANQRHQVPRKP